MTESYIFQTYYDIDDKSIKAETRDKVSSSDIDIIKFILKREFPDLEYEIRYLPSEEGSFKDNLKITIISGAIGGTFTLGAVGLGYILSTPSEKEIEKQERAEWVSNRESCLEYQNNMQPQSNMKKYCENNYVMNRQTQKTKTLKEDSEINNKKTIIFHNNEKIFEKNVNRSDFNKFINEHQSEKISKIVTGTIDIISPVIKQDRNGKGLQWRGTYYGEELHIEKNDVLSNESNISFYMQDKNYKDQIKNGEKTFSNKEVVSAILEVSFQYDGEKVKNKSIYLKEIITEETSLEIALKEYTKTQSDKKNLKKDDLSDLPMTAFFNGEK